MGNNEKSRLAVPSYEHEQISSGLLTWINQYPNFPPDVKRFSFEFLDADKPGMMLSTIPSAYIVKRYHGGDYMAEYQFILVYRGQPSNDNERLKMAEVLDAIGEWIKKRRDKPDIGSGKSVQKFVINENATLVRSFDNKDQDYQTAMTMTYYARA